jgi:hypothetical protein
VLLGDDGAERVSLLDVLRLDAHHAPENLSGREVQPADRTASDSEVRLATGLLARTHRDEAGDQSDLLEP